MELTDYHFLQQLANLSFIDAIWLYGSRARGDHQERSDIDLALLCPSATIQNWSEVTEIIENADTLLKIDCVRYDELKDNKFKTNINKFKKVLYART